MIIKIITTNDMNLETILILDQLMQLPKCCIYALVNDQDKRVQVYHTKSVLTHLMNIVDNIRNNTKGYELIEKDTKLLRICIL